MTRCRLDFTTDGWHILATCDCGSYRDDVTGRELPLIINDFNQHCDAVRSHVHVGVDHTKAGSS